MRGNTKEEKDLPCVIVEENYIINVNNEFFDFTDFDTSDLIGKSFITVWNQLLKIYQEPSFIHSGANVYIFTKFFQARYVTIEIQKNTDKRMLYLFKEVPDTRLEEKNQFIKKLIDDNVTGIGVYTVPDLMLIKANQTYLNYLPIAIHTKQQAYGKCIKDLIHNFEESNGKKAWENIIEKNQSLYIKERQGLMISDDDRYWDNTIVPITENVEVKYVVSMLDDVTEHVMSREHLRKQAEVIRMQNKQLETIIDNISDVITITDREGNTIKSNKAAREVSNFLNPDRDINWNEEVQYFDGTGYPLKISSIPRLKLLQGESVVNEQISIKYEDKIRYYSITTTPILDDDGRYVMGITCSHDITKNVLQEQELRKKKEELEAIIESISDALVVVDKTGKYIITNKVFQDVILDKTGDEKLLRKPGDSIELGFQYFDKSGNELGLKIFPTMKVLKGEKVEGQRIVVKDGSGEIHLDFSATPIFDENGEFKFGVVISHNVTDLVNSKQALLENQQLLLESEKEKNKVLEEAMKIKDEFFYLITHEFKTPMAVINSALQVIDLICKEGICDKLKKYLNIIKQNTNRQLRLVNNLLDITRINSGYIRLNKSKVDVQYVTKEIVNSVELYAAQKNIDLRFISSIKKEDLYLDEEKYERILLNLLSNALKFTPRGKRIEVFLSIIERKNKKFIRIQVKDQGIGIPKDRQKLIFERFEQSDTSLSRQAEGTGLGLHLVKLLIEQLSGEIALESEVGEGSTFTVLLPVEKGIELEKALWYGDNILSASNDKRVIQAVAIEFSDIYL